MTTVTLTNCLIYLANLLTTARSLITARVSFLFLFLGMGGGKVVK